MTPERLELLMVKVVDDVASPAEKEELMSHLSDNPALRTELESQRALKALTDGWVERLELDLVEDRHRASAATRLEAAFGLGLLLVGTAILVAFGAVELMVDPEVPMQVRIGLTALLGGTGVLLFSVVRWRLATRKSDKYTEVIR